VATFQTGQTSNSCIDVSTLIQGQRGAKSTRNCTIKNIATLMKAVLISWIHSILVALNTFNLISLTYPTLKISILTTLTSVLAKLVVKSCQMQTMNFWTTAMILNSRIPSVNHFSCASGARRSSTFIRSTTST